MARKTSTDKLEGLKKRRDEIDARIQAVSARLKDELRKAATRRKVIAGALALEHSEKNPESAFAKQMDRLLDEYVIRPHDRALFPQLPEVTAPDDQPSS
ncbi:hypothetical protein FBZ89_114131 [Nitrospirillum amazonense]|uniref:Relaxasome subunit MobC n=1 Tax=Nitrospirillum amazonense TaxID=28077 RepID=A0A560F1R7_9PROT|nr:mobilization protein C [Nitrospirillum amazonense]TWB15537.1 hypothetical protein FBZ89_114131 [Nitrospirillum amazonense]